MSTNFYIDILWKYFNYIKKKLLEDVLKLNSKTYIQNIPQNFEQNKTTLTCKTSSLYKHENIYLLIMVCVTPTNVAK